MNGVIKLALCLVVACAATACTLSPTAKCEAALTEGNLKEAEAHLKLIDDGGKRRYYGGLLIDEYLAVENIDRAIYVFDKITGHCSMYDMQWSHKTAAGYTQTYSKNIYNALIKAGRYDEAWSYHSLSYESENYPGNSPDYFAYMTDCIMHMCSTGNSAQASQFIKHKSVWFLKNVDNHKWGEEYPEYRYETMRSELNKVYNSAQ